MSAKRDIWVLLGLWAIATACNLTKPYTVDDGAHLLIAQWIAGHPLHPMRGILNWTGTPQPISATNQPHLYFYALAIWGSLFGWGEIPMHVLQSLFTAAAILFMYALAKRLAPTQALFLTAALALNPAFIVSQNLMIDIPLLAAWLAVFLCLTTRRFLLAATACATALLMKYSSLVLLPILLVTSRRARPLFIPLAALAAWSAFNWWDYGGIHLLTDFHAGQATYTPRAHKSFELERRLVKAALDWIALAGALSPFGILALAKKDWLYPALGAGFVALCLLPNNHLLWFGFAASGLALCTLLTGKRDMLWWWVILTSAFYMLLAPCLAARHVLLILPALAFLAARHGPFSRTQQIFTLALSAVLSLGLEVSDYRTAAFYRTEAATLAAPKTMTAGHWGWQYYAQLHGITELDTAHPPPPDTRLLVPREVDYLLPPGLKTTPVQTLTSNASAFDPLCTGTRFYLTYTFEGPYSLTHTCVVSLDVLTVR